MDDDLAVFHPPHDPTSCCDAIIQPHDGDSLIQLWKSIGNAGLHRGAPAPAPAPAPVPVSSALLQVVADGDRDAARAREQPQLAPALDARVKAPPGAVRRRAAGHIAVDDGCDSDGSEDPGLLEDDAPTEGLAGSSADGVQGRRAPAQAATPAAAPPAASRAAGGRNVGERNVADRVIGLQGRTFIRLKKGGLSLECGLARHRGQGCAKDCGFGSVEPLTEAQVMRRLLAWEFAGSGVDRDTHSSRKFGGPLLRDFADA